MASNYLCVAGDIPKHTQRGSCGSNTHVERATWVCLEIGYIHNYSTIYSHLPSGYVNIAIDNDHLQWIFPLIMVIFYSYVSLPEGTQEHDDQPLGFGVHYSQTNPHMKIWDEDGEI